MSKWLRTSAALTSAALVAGVLSACSTVPGWQGEGQPLDLSRVTCNDYAKGDQDYQARVAAGLPEQPVFRTVDVLKAETGGAYLTRACTADPAQSVSTAIANRDDGLGRCESFLDLPGNRKYRWIEAAANAVSAWDGRWTEYQPELIAWVDEVCGKDKTATLTDLLPSAAVGLAPAIAAADQRRAAQAAAGAAFDEEERRRSLTTEWTDADGYTYRVDFSSLRVLAQIDVANAKPGEAFVTWAISYEGSIANLTPKRNAPFTMFAMYPIWPRDSPVCAYAATLSGNFDAFDAAPPELQEAWCRIWSPSTLSPPLSVDSSAEIPPPPTKQTRYPVPEGEAARIKQAFESPAMWVLVRNGGPTTSCGGHDATGIWTLQAANGETGC